VPRISEFYGIAIYVYWQDHSPPHFHAIYSGHDASVRISTGDVLEGSLPRRARNMVRDWALQHQGELTENWNRAQRGEPLVQIDPLE
jgi:hypothetical protein